MQNLVQNIQIAFERKCRNIENDGKYEKIDIFVSKDLHFF